MILTTMHFCDWLYIGKKDQMNYYRCKKCHNWHGTPEGLEHFFSNIPKWIRLKARISMDWMTFKHYCRTWGE